MIRLECSHSACILCSHCWPRHKSNVVWSRSCHAVGGQATAAPYEMADLIKTLPYGSCIMLEYSHSACIICSHCWPRHKSNVVLSRSCHAVGGQATAAPYEMADLIKTLPYGSCIMLEYSHSAYIICSHCWPRHKSNVVWSRSCHAVGGQATAAPIYEMADLIKTLPYGSCIMLEYSHLACILCSHWWPRHK